MPTERQFRYRTALVNAAHGRGLRLLERESRTPSYQIVGKKPQPTEFFRRATEA